MPEFGPEIWLSDGGKVDVLGFQYPTRMAVIRLDDGSLLIWSPIALTDALRRDTEALGAVRHIVAPNALHHLFIGDWQRAYPDARTYAPPKLRTKRRDLTFDADLTDTPPTAWAGQIDQTLIHGNLITTEVVFFHRASRTALFCDLLQQFPKDAHKGWRGTVANLDLMTQAQPAVPRKFRTAFVNRKAARRAIHTVLDWPSDRVIMAHGTPVTGDAKPYLARAFNWLVA